jgi:hypothetical protein
MATPSSLPPDVPLLRSPGSSSSSSSSSSSRAPRGPEHLHQLIRLQADAINASVTLSASHKIARFSQFLAETDRDPATERVIAAQGWDEKKGSFPSPVTLPALIDELEAGWLGASVEEQKELLAQAQADAGDPIEIKFEATNLGELFASSYKPCIHFVAFLRSVSFLFFFCYMEP